MLIDKLKGEKMAKKKPQNKKSKKKSTAPEAKKTEQIAIKAEKAKNINSFIIITFFY